MKTFFTTFSLVIFFLSSSAQKDWALVSIDNPKELEIFQGNTDVELEITCENIGSTVITTQDTILLSFVIFDVQTQELLAEFPNQATQGAMVPVIPDRNIPANTTATMGFMTSFPSTWSQSRNVRLSIRSFILNSSNPFHDVDSSNNQIVSDFVWYNETRNGVFVNNVSEISIKSYPNPVNDILNIEFPNAEGDLEVNVIDMNGRFVLSDKFYSINGTCTIDTKHIEEGTYILQFKQGNTIRNQRITILHH